MFEQFPYTNFHELNLDWIVAKIKDWLDHYNELNTAIQNKLNRPEEDPNGEAGEFLISNGDGTTHWYDYEPVAQQQIKDEVDEWLSQHPEYIVDIQNDSIASLKLKKTNIPFYCVTDYGIYPNSGDVYEPLHDFFRDHVYNTGGIVYFPAGRYTLSFTSFIPENTMLIGAGPDKTEIYYNQESTHFGVGLCNAGSNIAICNMKLSQYSTGIFHTGSQPGCMAFSTIDKTQVLEDAYSHNYITSETGQTENLRIENVTFSGFYAIGVENRPGTVMKNITIRNIIAPNCCVSVRPHAGDTVENILIDNVECDLFRLGTHLETTGIIRRCIANNIKCTTLVYFNSEPCIINNMLLDTTVKNNDVSFLANCVSSIKGPITINDSKFDFSTANTGMYLLGGAKYFNRVSWNCKYRFVSRGGNLNDHNDYEVYNNNIFTTQHDGSSTVPIMGFGNNNRFIDLGVDKAIRNGIIGDTTRNYNIGTSSEFQNRVTYHNGTFFMNLYVTIANTNNVYTFPEGKDLCQNSWTVIPILLINSNTPANNRMSFGKLENGKISVTETGLTASTAYDKAMIVTNYVPTEEVNMQSFYNTFF